MSSRPAHTHRVALVGFSEFERATLATFFRLSTRRTPRYVEGPEVEQSAFVVVDGDQPGAVRSLRAAGRLGDAVFIGDYAPAEAMSRLPRPIDPMAIARELDLLVGLRLSEAEAQAGDEALSRGEVDLLLESTPVDDAASSVLEPVFEPPPARAKRRRRPPVQGGMGRDVLVVEDSAVARKFLSLRLQRLNYRVHTASRGEDALRALAVQAFVIVFVDLQLGPPGQIDGLGVCQHVKATLGDHAPAVVIVTGQSGSADRVRATLAGCDAYLVKPLLEAEFVRTLRTVDPLFEWEPVAAG